MSKEAMVMNSSLWRPRNPALSRIARLVFLLLPVLCSGCGPLLSNSTGEREYFILDDDQSLPSGTPRSAEIDLVVRDARSNRFVNSHKIIFSDDPTTRGYYQLAQWVEPPPKRVSGILISKLERSNAFRTVTSATSATFARLQLNVQVLEYYHDTSEEPGLAKVRLVAELVNLQDRQLIAQQEFSKGQAIEDYSARGAVAGLNAATNQVLNEVVLWAATQASQISAGPPGRAASGHSPMGGQPIDDAGGDAAPAP